MSSSTSSTSSTGDTAPRHTASRSNILIGSLSTTADPSRIAAAFASQGGDPTMIDVITDQPGVSRHFTSTDHLGRLGRLARRISVATDDTAEHLVDTVRAEVALGRSVVVVRGVARDQVAEAASRLRGIGAHDLHYTGRWTSNDHGLIPRPERSDAA